MEWDARQLVVVPEEETRGAQIVSVGKPKGCIAAIDRAVDADAPLLRRQTSRAAQDKSLRPSLINEPTIANIRALNEIARRRGQTLAQMALAWVLRGGRVTSALIGASRPEQVEDCVGALNNRGFTADELAEIDRYATEANINLWAASAERKGPPRK